VSIQMAGAQNPEEPIVAGISPILSKPRRF